MSTLKMSPQEIELLDLIGGIPDCTHAALAQEVRIFCPNLPIKNLYAHLGWLTRLGHVKTCGDTLTLTDLGRTTRFVFKGAAVSIDNVRKALDRIRHER